MIGFTKVKKEFSHLTMNSGQIDPVYHARILGLTISKYPEWKQHATEIV